MSLTSPATNETHAFASAIGNATGQLRNWFGLLIARLGWKVMHLRVSNIRKRYVSLLVHRHMLESARMASIKKTCLLCIATWFALLHVSRADANTPTPPRNIIWILGEDMGPDLGCWGTNVHTPHIDKLAADGMRFTHLFGTASVCMPNRTAMITGVTQTTLGAVTMRPPKKFMRPLPAEVVPLPVLLRRLGYLTGNVGREELGCNGKDDWNFQYDGETWNTRELDDLKGKQPFYAPVQLRHGAPTIQARHATPSRSRDR